MPSGIAVVVIAHNEDDVIERCLLSIIASTRYLREREPTSQVEIVLVSDGSTDRTVEVAANCMVGYDYFKIVSLEGPQGPSGARNQGAYHTDGEILCFIDGDDEIFQHHLWVVYKIFEHTDMGKPLDTVIDGIPGGRLVIPVIHGQVGVLRTSVQLDDNVHPEWHTRIENVIPLNMAVRRVCHQFVEGWPAYSPFRRLALEDCAYARFVSSFFRTVKLSLPTCHYISYPGNTYDRQIKSGKFLTPPDRWVEPLPSKEELPYLELIRELELSRMAYLRKKMRLLGTPELRRLAIQ